MELLLSLVCVAPCLDPTSLHRLTRVVAALLCMTGRITMLGISRWTEAGGSYRTVQRLFNTEIPWPKLQWFLIRQHLMNQIGVILIVGDECTTPKAGVHTFGLGRFFSSIYNKTIPGLCHLTISLVSVRERIAYPLFTVPVPPTVKKEEAPAAAEPATKRGPGRPKGSRNSSRHDVEFTAFQLLLKTTLLSLLALIGADLPLAYFVYDGALGHNTGVQLVRQCGLHLISKLRHDSALYFPFAGPQSGRGRHKKYGSRINLTGLPKRFLKRTSVKDGIREAIYQITLLHKNFADPLNVVIIIRTNLKTKKSAHAFLFSSDLDLAWDKLIEYYALRFQIEFNFRDAKQYWGLDDFMSIKERPATNAANLAFFMINLSHLLRRLPQFAGMSVLDLKSWFRARKYVHETLKCLPENPDPILIETIVQQVASLGRINQPMRVASG